MRTFIFPVAAILLLFTACTGSVATPGAGFVVAPDTAQKHSFPYDTLANYPWLSNPDTVNTLAKRIPLPQGFKRVEAAPGSYASWLRNLPLLEENAPVKLYNGSLKGTQDVHVAVINIDVGNKDLQQCADAVMRLRAEYLYSKKNWEAIHFNYTSGDRIDFTRWSKGERPAVKGNKVSWVVSAKKGTGHGNFREYLDNVFNYAGSKSLSKELIPVKQADMKPGDVFIVGGFPGHAVTVLDMAVNPATGEKLFMLCQSYMPAQQVHVLKNPDNAGISPWYSLNFKGDLETPEWTFPPNSLMRFAEPATR